MQRERNLFFQKTGEDESSIESCEKNNDVAPQVSSAAFKKMRSNVTDTSTHSIKNFLMNDSSIDDCNQLVREPTET
jgi:hypothetical protein